MNKWKIVLTKSAQKALTKLSQDKQEFILEYLYNHILILQHPKQLGKALRHDLKGLWRYRIEKYRIICKIEEDKLIILVLRIGKREVVYDD